MTPDEYVSEVREGHVIFIDNLSQADAAQWLYDICTEVDCQATDAEKLAKFQSMYDAILREAAENNQHNHTRKRA